MTKYVIQGSNQLSWQKYCQIRLKGEEIGQNEGKLSDFWDSIHRKWTDRITQLRTCTIQEKKIMISVSECRCRDSEGIVRGQHSPEAGPAGLLQAHRADQATENYIQVLKPIGNCPASL